LNMKTIGNVLWFLLGGFIGAVITFLEALLCFISILYIPVGLQLLKMAEFLLWPMGKQVVVNKPSGFKTVINILWLIFNGWENFLAYGIVGILFCITIIGIPFGRQYFKLATFIAMPLGHDFAVSSK